MSEAITKEEALEVIKNFGIHSPNKILEAVNVLKNDRDQEEVLNKFFKDFYNIYGKQKPNNDCDIILNILRQSEKSEYTEPFIKSVNSWFIEEYNRAKSEWKKPNGNLTFSELDTLAAAGRALNNDVGSLSTINAKVIEKIEDETTTEQQSNAKSNEYKGLPDEEMDALWHYISRQKEGRNKNNLLERASELNSEYDIANGLNKNIQELEEYNEQEVVDINDEDKDFKAFLDRIVIEDEESDAESDEQKKQGNKDEIIALLKDAAKIRAQQKRLTDKNASAEEEFKLLVAEAYVAGTMEEFPSNDTICNAPKWEKYLKSLHDEAEKRLKKFGEGEDKIKLKVNDIITALAVTEVEAKKFSKNLSRKLKGAETKIGKKADQLGEKAKALWDKRYEIARAVADNISDRKWQYITNGVLAVGASAVMGVGGVWAGVAIGCYGAYTVAGNYVWPVVAEMRKTARIAEKNGNKVPPFKKRWKDARATLKNSKSYQSRCKWGWLGGVAAAGLGIASMGLISGNTIGLASDAASKLSPKAAKILAGICRTVGSSAASLQTNIYAQQDYNKDQSDANMASLRQARISSICSLAGAGIAAYIGLNRLDAMNASDLAEAGSGGNNGGNGGSGMGTGYTNPQTGAYTPDSTAADSLRYYMGQDQDSVAPGNDSSGSGSGYDYNGGNQSAIQPFDPSELRGNEVHMYNVLNRKFPDGTIASYLSSIRDNEFVLGNGHYPLPDGVSRMQALFAYQRLDEWTRGLNNEEVRTNVRILGALFRVKDCDDIENFTSAQIKKAISMIPSVKTETGVRDVMIEGCPCPQKGYVFGTIDYDKLNAAIGTNLKPKIDSATGLPILKGVRAPGWNFNDPCDPKPHFERVAVNCDCEEKPIEKPEVKVEKPVVEEVVEVQPTNIPVNFAEHKEEIKISSNHGETVHVRAADSGEGASYITKTDTNHIDFEKAALYKKDPYFNDPDTGVAMVRVWYTGDVKDNITGYQGVPGDRDPYTIEMTREAWERGKAGNPIEYETKRNSVNDAQYALLNNPTTQIDIDEVKLPGYSRFTTSIEGMEHITIPSAADLDATACNISITRDGDFRVLNMQDENGQPIRIGFNEKGEGWIKNGKDEYVVMNKADREAMSETLTNYVKDHSEELFGKKVDAQFDFSLAKNTLTGRLDDIRNQDVKTNSVEYRREVEQKNVSFAKMLNNAKNSFYS